MNLCLLVILIINSFLVITIGFIIFASKSIFCNIEKQEVTCKNYVITSNLNDNNDNKATKVNNDITQITRDKIYFIFDILKRNNIEHVSVNDWKSILLRVLGDYNIKDLDLIINALTFNIPGHILVTELYKFINNDIVKSRLETFIVEFATEYQIINYVYSIMYKYQSDFYNSMTLEDIGLQDIYVINLKERPDRLKHINNQFKELNFNITVFPAFYGKSLELKLRNNITVENLNQESKLNYKIVKQDLINKKESWNTVGCWQSHLHVYFKIRDKALELNKNSQNNTELPTLILEDDVIVDFEFKTIIKNTLPKLPSDWEVFACGHCFLKCDLYSKTFFQDICKASEILCLHAYIIRDSTVANKLIQHLNTKQFEIPDVVTNNMVKNNQLNVYAINPEIIKQNQDIFGSDISGTPISEIKFEEEILNEKKIDL